MYLSFAMLLPEDGHRSRRNVQKVYGVYNILSLTCVLLLVLIPHLAAQYTVMDHLKLLCTVTMRTPSIHRHVVSAVGRYYPLLASEILWFYVTTSGCTQLMQRNKPAAAAPRYPRPLRVTL